MDEKPNSVLNDRQEGEMEKLKDEKGEKELHLRNVTAPPFTGVVLGDCDPDKDESSSTLRLFDISVDIWRQKK